MVTIKINPASEGTSAKILRKNIRRHFDEKAGVWYFSIIDVIGILTDSTDARNYWKVLKNRLNKSSPQLVTKCNQLKMPAKDGKFYLTDTADSETMLEIIESVPQASAEAFKLLLEEVDEEGNFGAEAELLVDAYQDATSIFIRAFVAGVDPENLDIYVDTKKVIISGERLPPRVNKEADIEQGLPLLKELLWTTFARTILLPAPIEKDNIKKSVEDGLFMLELTKKV